jgi:hypothetical protein
MCCCAKPNVNGEPGYSWDGENIGVREPSAPELQEGDTLLFDEPGRCGGLDSHCHHYRLVKDGSRTSLLVRHGGGEERVRVCLPRGFSLEGTDSNTRYWLLNAIYHAHAEGKRAGLDSESSRWRTAFADGRLKKRKMPGRDAVKVWIEPAQLSA